MSFAEGARAQAQFAPDELPDVIELTVADVQEGYRSGAWTAEQLVAAYLERIGTYEDRYNAFVSLNPGALADAARLDAERERARARVARSTASRS